MGWEGGITAAEARLSGTAALTLSPTSVQASPSSYQKWGTNAALSSLLERATSYEQAQIMDS